MSNSTVKITLVKSPIGTIPGHRKTVRALGLRKIGASKTHTMTPSVKGMVKQVEYLLKVEEAK